MRPLRSIVQKHKLRTGFQLFINYTYTHTGKHIFLLVSRTHLLILTLTSKFLAQNVIIIRKKNWRYKPQGESLLPEIISHCSICAPCLISSKCTLLTDKVGLVYNLHTLRPPSNTVYSEGAQDVLLELNPCKRALFTQDTAPCLTSSFPHK